MKRIILSLLGVVLVLLGSLWTLQGLDIIRIAPILCFADCQPVTGGSVLWFIVGLITFALGSIMLFFSFKKKTKDSINSI